MKYNNTKSTNTHCTQKPGAILVAFRVPRPVIEEAVTEEPISETENNTSEQTSHRYGRKNELGTVKEIGGKLYLVSEGNFPQLLFGASIAIAYMTRKHVTQGSVKNYVTVLVKKNTCESQLVSIAVDEFFQNSFKRIGEACPDVIFRSVIPNGGLYMRDYLSQLLSAVVDRGLPTEDQYLFCGWYRQGMSWQYLHDGMPNVTSTVTLDNKPNKKPERRLSVHYEPRQAFHNFFALSSHFLRPGQEAANLLIFLHSHLGYLARLMQEAGAPVHHALYLKGRSNSGKTNLLAAISGEIFCNPPTIARLEDTQSFLEGVIDAMRDSIILIDDAHPAATRDKANIIRANIETVVRTFGDGQKRGIRGPGGQLVKEAVSEAVWMTGEYYHLASYSSYLRVLLVSIEDDGVDWGTIDQLQQRPNIARDYYTGYIHYLEEHFDDTVAFFRSAATERRQYWKQVLPNCISRTADIGMAMDFAIFTVVGYAASVGIDIADWDQEAQDLIKSYLLDKVRQDIKADPVEIFRQAIKDLYDSGDMKIASDKLTFKDHKEFLGYREANKFFVIYKRLKDRVMEWCGQQHIAYMEPDLSLLYQRKILLEEHPVRFTTDRYDTSRPTMLVISIPALNKGAINPIPMDV